jgi:hypothetical protein
MLTTRMIGRGKTTLRAMVLTLGGAALLAGCRAPVEPTAPSLARVTVADPDQFETLWQATDKTLRRYALEPDRQDRTEGVIVTRPETSAAWFEFWRPQPTAAAYAWWEANLQTIRRQAKVTIQPTAAAWRSDWRQGVCSAADKAAGHLAVHEAASAAAAAAPEYQIAVEVERYRYSLGERQIDNPAAAMRLFGNLAPTEATGRRQRQAESSRWLPLGRDGELEQAILTDILKRYGAGEFVNPPESPASQPAGSTG